MKHNSIDTAEPLIQQDELPSNDSRRKSFNKEQKQDIDAKVITPTKDYFERYKSSTLEKKKKLEEQYEAEERKKCKFRPTTDYISNRIEIEKKRTNVNRFNELYKDSKKPKENKKEISDPECTFKPSLTQYKKSLCVVERSKKSIEDELKKELTFKPKTNINPKMKSTNLKEASEGMYNQSARIKAKINKMKMDEEQKLKDEANKRFTQNKSNEIVEAKKRKQIIEIFKILDSNDDGKISIDSMGIDRIIYYYYRI